MTDDAASRYRANKIICVVSCFWRLISRRQAARIWNKDDGSLEREIHSNRQRKLSPVVARISIEITPSRWRSDTQVPHRRRTARSTQCVNFLRASLSFCHLFLFHYRHHRRSITVASLEMRDDRVENNAARQLCPFFFLVANDAKSHGLWKIRITRIRII